jgi:hypothetical protein
MQNSPEEDYIFDFWVPEKTCAKYLGISTRALAKLRKEGAAPAHIRVSPRGLVLYPSEAINDYLRDIWLNSPKPEPETEKIEEL